MLPQGWEWKKLGDISKKIFAGGDKPEVVSEVQTNELNIPIYANAVKDNGLYGYSNVYRVDEECITISARGTIGFTVVRNEKFFPIVRLIVVIPSEKVLSQILKYYLDYELVENTGSSIPQLTVPTVKELLIPLPPLEEQGRIVGVLDGLFGKIDTSIALLDESIASASSLMPSALNEVFEELKIKNELVAIKQVIVNIQTGTTPSKQIEKYYKVPLEIEWFSPSDFKEEKILHNSKNKLNKIALEERKVKLYDENSLLLVAIGATVGKIGVIREKATSNQQITALKFDNSVNVDFAYYWFKHIKEFIIGQASTATLPIINQNGIKELPFIKVPLDIQTQTVAYLDALHVKADALKKAQEKKKEALLALKASLLESAFKGAL